MKHTYHAHKDVVHISAGVLAILVFAFYIGMFTTTQAQNTHKLVCDEQVSYAENGALENSLGIIGNRLGDGSSIADPSNLKNLLSLRKAGLRKLMQTNPEEAFRFIVNRDELKVLKKKTSNCIEAYIEIEGDTEVMHTDFENDTSLTEYYLRTEQGELVTLHRRGAEHVTLISGMHIKVRGHKLDNDMLINGDDPEGIIETKKPERHSFHWKFWEASHANALVPSSMGPQNTIVILANFSDTNSTSPSVSSASSTVFGSVNNFYKETSYGKTHIAGHVVGWYKMTIARSCVTTQIRNAAIAAADPTVDFRNYSRIIIIAPMYCPGIAGYGTIGKTNVTTGDGTVNVSVAWILPNYADLRVISHELGHNLGMHHASSITCGAGPITATAPSGCTLREYGDPYAAMGSHIGDMNAPHKDYIGWFDTPYATEVTANGTYTLAPIERLPTSTSPLSLKIRRSAIPFDYLYAEFRQPILTDARFGTTSDGVKGALIHNLQSANKTQLIDTTASLTGVSLQPGKSFKDPLTGTVISTISVNPDALTVSISMGKTDFISPTVSILSPMQSHNAATTASASGTLMISADASDKSGIQKVEFWRSGATLPFAIATSAPYTANWDTRKAPNGTNWIYAKAYDNSGTPWGGVNNSAASPSVVVNVENTDSTFPTAKITAPLQNAIVKSPVTMIASASDNSGVYSVKFFLNDTLYATDLTSPYSYAGTFATGTYSVYAVATDYAGNATTTPTITFSVDNSPPVVTVTSPEKGSFVPPLSTTTMTATAIDETSMSKGKVYFYVNNVQKCLDSSAPYSCNWLVPANSTTTATTTYSIKARGYDTAGNSSFSASFNVYGLK